MACRLALALLAMLGRIISLKGIGRFEGYNASGDVTFKKYTLIFAENAVGKSTLCDVIRSLQTGNPDYILGRKTLGAIVEPEAKILLADGAVATFSNGAWSRTPAGGVSIFDAGYIRENVHAGEAVFTEHRKGLFQVIVGHEGIELLRRVEDLERQKTELNTPIRTAKQAIEAGLPPGMSLQVFLDLEADPQVEGKIDQARRDVSAARKSDELARHRPPAPVPVPSIPTELGEILMTTLDDVSADAEHRLREHLNHLGFADGERWLAQGLALMRDETCPFCAQDIRESDLVSTYQVCFSEVYRSLADQVAELPHTLDAVAAAAADRIAMVIAQNAEARTFWCEYCAIDTAPPINIDRVRMVLAEAHAAGLELVERKASNPLEAMPETERLTASRGALDDVADEISQMNEWVARTTACIEETRRRLGSTSLVQEEAKLKALVATAKRFAEPLASTCMNYHELTALKDNLDKEKQRAREALDRHTEQVIKVHQTGLNYYLDRFMAGFRIQGTRTEFPRGIPSSSYQLVINNIPVEVGSDQTPNTEPSFRNTLSGGDRSALALSLFMAQIDRAANKPDIAVVLDDPFQSQDAFRRNATAFQLRRLGEACGQVIVMSHDAHFLKLVWDELPAGDRKALRLNAVGRTTTLSEWDISEHLRSAHQANINAMQRYLDHGRGNVRDVAQKLRPALEGYCKIVCFGEFGEHDMMGDIIVRVRTAGGDHPLHAILDDLEELNSYARRYHHATNVDADTEPLNEGALQGYCRRILQLMRLRPN